MKTNEFTTWKCSELEIEKIANFIYENFKQTNEKGEVVDIDSGIMQDLKRQLIYLVDASTMDVINATGNFLKQFNNALLNDLKEEHLVSSK